MTVLNTKNLHKKPIAENINVYIAFLCKCLSEGGDIEICTENISWGELLAFAKRQEVVGLYWNGICQQSGSTNRLSADDVLDWMSLVERIKQRNKLMNISLANFSDYLTSNDVRFKVFKGQTVAQDYPLPELRTCGDIDFYVPHTDWDRALNVISRKVKFSTQHSSKHLEFIADGISYEMHMRTASFAKKEHQEYWGRLIDNADDDNYVCIGKRKIPVFPPTVNAVYLFVHIYHHFLKEGIGLRQLVDWMMFLKRHKNDIERKQIIAILEHLGYMRAYGAFGCILTDYLGLSEDDFPIKLTSEDKKYTKDILSIIVRYGSFGKYGRLMTQGGLLHSFETGLRSVHHVSRFFYLSPEENLRLIPHLLMESWKNFLWR